MAEPTAYQRRILRLQTDIDNGRIQELVDNGFSILQIAKRYDVSENKIRSYSKIYGGPVFFPQTKGVKKEADVISEWSDAKRLAISGKW